MAAARAGAAAAAATGSVSVGDAVDALDTSYRWLVADVLDVKGGEAFVHYVGWASRWDSWVSVSGRVAPLGTHTDGQPYGLGRARDAVERDDLDALRALVTRETVNRQHECRPPTLLLCAVSNNNTDAARVLLEELGADPNLGNDHGRTPLHCACASYGDVDEELLLLLLLHGADTDAHDKDGDTPLVVCRTAETRARFESAVRRFTQYVCGVARAVDAYLYPHEVVDQFVLEYVFGANTVNDSKAALAEARRSDGGGGARPEQEEEQDPFAALAQQSKLLE